MKSVLVTIVDGFHYRYLVQSGIIDRLVNESDCRLTLVVQEQLLPMATQKYAQNENIIISCLPQVQVSKPMQAFLQIRRRKSKRLSKTMNIKNEANNSFIYDIVNYFCRLIPEFVLKKFGRWAFSNQEISQTFKANKFDVVITSTPSQKVADIPFCFEANQKSIPIISPVYSWDNLTAKGPFACNIDHLLVWNHVLLNEAMHYHGYKKESVSVTGVPTYDIYRAVLESCRDTFFQKLGLNKSLPLITIATVPRVYYGSGHKEIVNTIILAVSEGLLPELNILIRPHPMDDTDYSDLSKSGIVFVDEYGSKPDSSLQSWKPNNDNLYHLGATMKHSDIVLNVASTIAIDSAWFDTPVINVAIDMKNPDYEGSIRRYYDYTHYKEVVDCHASSLAYTDNELISSIKLYLDNPDNDSEARTTLVNKMCISREFNAVEATVIAIKGIING